MNLVKVYGYSDDLVEIEEVETSGKGVTLESEFDAYGEPADLLFESGTRLKVEYNEDGLWKIDIVYLAPGDVVESFFEANDESEENGDGYSDILMLRTESTEVMRAGDDE